MHAHLDLPRRTDLPDGRCINVRVVRPDDIAELQRLYDQLSDEDRYRRFFTLYHPDRAFFERLTAIGDRGGVAVVVEDLSGDDAPIVAEAEYELLENGNGEMAVVVAETWRGWLGPYLVGILAGIAADRGVPNLEAEMLTTNLPMRSLTRTRGEAVLPGSDWRTARVEFSTAGRAPGWFATDRPRVLIEARSPMFEALDELAPTHAIVACSGPTGRPRPCPLLDGGECPLAADADAIVIAMPDDAVRDSLIAAHQGRHGQVPVEVVESGLEQSCDAVHAAVERALTRAGSAAAGDPLGPDEQGDP